MKIAPTLRALGIACALGAILAAPAAAQSVAPKPVRIVLPYSAGSGPDAVARHVGEKLSKVSGQSAVIDNKPGANGWLAINDVKRAVADGSTLVGVDNTHFALQQHLYKQMPFTATTDFEPVAGLYFTNFFIVVSADSPWNSVSDLIAAAKAKKLSYGTWGIGSVAHVGTAMLQAGTGTEMLHVPFKELPQLYTAVATKEVDWAFGTAATVGPLYRAKRVKLLALAAPRRLAGFTEVPTVAESGGPAGFELKTWVALFAPKGMAKPAVDQMNASVGKALAEPDIRERLATVGFQAWTATPAQILTAMEEDTRRFAEVVKQARISID